MDVSGNLWLQIACTIALVLIIAVWSALALLVCYCVIESEKSKDRVHADFKRQLNEATDPVQKERIMLAWRCWLGHRDACYALRYHREPQKED